MRDSKLRWLANDGVMQMKWNLGGAVGGVEASGSIYCWLMTFSACTASMIETLERNMLLGLLERFLSPIAFHIVVLFG